MLRAFLFIVITLMVNTAKADQTTNAVQVTCYPYSGHVEARLIDYYNCGDGHCVEDDFDKTEEAKQLLKDNITLILPYKSTNIYTCDFGDATLEVTATPSYGTDCNEEAFVSIKHNDKLVADKKVLWKDCWTSKEYKGLRYRAFTKSSDDISGSLSYEQIDEEGIVSFTHK